MEKTVECCVILHLQEVEFRVQVQMKSASGTKSKHKGRLKKNLKVLKVQSSRNRSSNYDIKVLKSN